MIKQYTNWQGHKVIKGRWEAEVRDAFYDAIGDGYNIVTFPRPTLYGFGRNYIARLEKPKGQAETRFDRNPDEWGGMHL